MLLECCDELWCCGVMSEVCFDEGGEMGGVMSIAVMSVRVRGG